MFFMTNRGNNMANVSGHALRIDLHTFSTKSISRNAENGICHDLRIFSGCTCLSMHLFQPTGGLKSPYPENVRDARWKTMQNAGIPVLSSHTARHFVKKTLMDFQIEIQIQRSGFYSSKTPRYSANRSTRNLHKKPRL